MGLADVARKAEWVGLLDDLADENITVLEVSFDGEVMEIDEDRWSFVGDLEITDQDGNPVALGELEEAVRDICEREIPKYGSDDGTITINVTKRTVSIIGKEKLVVQVERTVEIDDTFTVE